MLGNGLKVFFTKNWGKT